MVIRRVVIVVVVVLAALAGGSARATDSNALRLLMLSAQDMNTPQTLLRADIAIEIEGPQGKKTTDAVALFAPGKEARWYLQLREPALRALVLGNERKVMQKTGTTTETVPIGAPIDGLGIAYEDLSRFIVDDFKTWQITDEAADHVLVGMYPNPTVDSAYVYRVYSFDKEKTVPTKAQFYAKSLNNLVKLRLDSEHILIGKKWVPTEIQLQNYTDNTTTTLHVRWTPNATAPPELFTAASFPATSPLPATTASAPVASPAR
jgi:Outer membrane lipoprotein-sorting protein